MHAIDTCLFIGGMRDGTVHEASLAHDRLAMPAPMPVLSTRPETGKSQSMRVIESEIYLRSIWRTEDDVAFIFYRHESLTYADAIRLVLTRYAQR